MAATRAKTQDIESRSQMRSATDGHRADAPGGEPRGDCRRDGPHNDESAHGVAMRAWSCPQVVAGPLPSRSGAIDPRNTCASGDSRSKGLGGRRRAPRSCSVNPHTIPVRGAPVSQPWAGHTAASTAAISGASAVFRGFRPASLPTATSRIRSRLGLIATVLEDVLRVRRDPHIGQERLQFHVTRRDGDQ
jgi:hypothetical protein